ncbi:N-acetylglucosamine kinase [Myroides sp. LJL115]
MKLIVDSGSTKADWVALDAVGFVSEPIVTLGLNPEVLTDREFTSRLEQNQKLEQISSKVTSIYFYGAGCGSLRTKSMVKRLLNSFFVHCKTIEVHEDTYAAIYALLGKGDKGIVCINGTGSNVSYFDAHQVTPLIESLGYMAMDDCSGSSFGRQILKSYFLKVMPKELSLDFEKEYGLDADKVKYNFYKQENPNAYMASFLPFLIKHKDHPFFVEMIEKELDYFIKVYLKDHPFTKDCKVNFVGSVAFLLQEEFKKALEEKQIQIGKFVQKPLDGLIEFHQ